MAVCMVFLLLPAQGIGQTAAYVSQHFTNDNGLPQNSVKEIKIDAAGYTWLWTEAGIVRFDGQRFLLINRFESGATVGTRIDNVYSGREGQIVVLLQGKYYHVPERLTLAPYSPSVQELATWSLEARNLSFDIFKQCLRQYEQGQIPKWAVPDPNRSDLYSQHNFLATEKGYYFFNESLKLVFADSSLTQFRRVVTSGLPPPGAKDWRLSLLRSEYGTYLRWGEFLYKCHFSSNGDSLHAARQLYVGDAPRVSAIGEIPGSGIFFVGTTTDGFYMFQPTPFTVLTFRDNTANNIYAHLPFGDSSILTPKGVLPEGHWPRLERYLIHTAFKSRDGRYFLNRWRSSWHSGIAVFDSTLKELKYVSVNNGPVTSYHELDNGEIWVATNERLLGKMKDTSIEWLPEPPGLGRFVVVTIMNAGKDEYWMGGRGGLIRLNIRTSEFYRVKELDSTIVRTIYRDSSGILWIGTNGLGLFALANGQLIPMPLDKNKYLLNTHAIVVDTNGFGWLPTNQGLFQVKMEDLRQYVRNRRNNIYYHLYDQSAGLLTNEFNGGSYPATVVLGNGKFSFPSLNGVVQFYPGAVKAIEPDAPIRIDKIERNQQKIAASSGSVTIPGNTPRLAVTVSSPYYGNKENKTLYYQLKGLDTTFYEVPENGEITFSGLRHGRYELLVKKAGGFNGKTVTRQLFLYVQPLFYETTLFKVLAALAAVIIIVAVFRTRTRNLKAQHKRLEAEVRLRTADQHRLINELEVAVADLKASKNSLQQKNNLQEQLTLMVAHDLQSPLRFLEDISRALKKAVSNARPDVIAALSSDLQEGTRKIHRFVREFGLWLKMKGEDFHLQGELVSLAEILEESTSFFVDIAGKRNIVLSTDCPQHLTVWVNRQMLTIILRNVIDNAIKYTSDGTVTIRAEQLSPDVGISVIDSGGGFSPESLQRVRGILESTAGGPAYETSESGYGYRFISDFCKVMNLEVSILSSNENGSVVQIRGLKTTRHNGNYENDRTGESIHPKT